MDSVASCLDDSVVVADFIKVSMFSNSRHNVEWSLDVESEVWVEFSLSWFTCPFINVDDVPLL
jgi:hypothetical protein